MCFSDSPFPYGPFVPHYIPRQYIENYYAIHKTDSFLVLNTTVEDLAWVSSTRNSANAHWKLSLRHYDATRQLDSWWEEKFDAVVLANGHYSVPFVCDSPVTEMLNIPPKLNSLLGSPSKRS
jgi:cation diffusion facilitator CzcD-associated flavoprotein CzcO